MKKLAKLVLTSTIALGGLGAVDLAINTQQASAAYFASNYHGKNFKKSGVEELPTKENIQNETYPLVDQFYAITAESDNPHIEAFINWMISEQGQDLVEGTGYVPVE